MRILFVSCLLPYPTVPHGGGTDLFHLVEALGHRGHEVHLVSLVQPEEAPHAPEMRPYVASLQTVTPALAWRQKLRNALREPPWRWGRRARAQVRAAIRHRVDAGVDVAQFEWTESARFVDAVTATDVVTVLDEVDVSFRPLARALGPTRRRVRAARARELAWCRRFDAVLTRSEADRAALAPHVSGTRLHVFQPWTHVDRFRGITPETCEPGTVLFCGAMNRRENADTVLWFARECWPRVREAVPTARLVVAGHAPLPRVARLAADPTVSVTGTVPDLRPVYARAHVCIAPSLVGGGVLNKVVDGMAAGRPVVTTTVGNEGVAAPPEAVRVADDPAAFADAVVRLLRDPAEWTRVARAGREYVQRTYRWDDNVARLEALYRELSTSLAHRSAW